MMVALTEEERKQIDAGKVKFVRRPIDGLATSLLNDGSHLDVSFVVGGDNELINAQ